MSTRDKIRRILNTARIIGWAVALALQFLVLYLRYQRLRVRLWWARKRNTRKFKKSLKGLPKELRRELAREYEEILDSRVRLPSVREILGFTDLRRRRAGRG